MSDHLEGSLSKFFNVEKRNSLLTQNQLHARATEWRSPARFLSIIKPDTDPSLILAADLINHELCLCVSTEK